MECPRRWAVLSFLIYFSAITNVCCQNMPYEGAAQIQSKDAKRDVSRVVNPSSKTVTYAAEAPFVKSIQDDRSKTFNLMPSQTPYYSQEPISFSGPPANIPNMIISPTSSASLTSPSARPSQTPVLSEPTSVNSFTNYANVVPSVTTVYPNDAYNYPASNPVMYTEVASPPVNLQISSSSGLEFLKENTLEAKFQKPIVLSNGYEDGYPVNLQINVPSQNLPAPRITFVSAAPQPVTSVNSEQSYNIPPFGFLPPLPIKRRSRSSLRKLLPILLIALLNNQNDCGNRGCCPCNCNCDCSSDNPIPIPYPIPIPTNNPIINTSSSSYSSRKRGQRDYDDDDDDDDNN